MPSTKKQLVDQVATIQPLINGLGTYVTNKDALTAATLALANEAGKVLESDPAVVAPPATTTVAGAVLYVDDALPVGAAAATNGDDWTWDTAAPGPVSGTRFHRSKPLAGMHQHYFLGAPVATGMPVKAGEVLTQWVWLDPNNLPKEVMLQWFTSDNSWEHRAIWGTDSIAWGVAGTVSRCNMGPIPAAAIGKWFKLTATAEQVGLVGKTVTGRAYTLYDGAACWDADGKEPAGTTSTVTPPPVVVVTPPPIVNPTPVIVPLVPRIVSGATPLNRKPNTGKILYNQGYGTRVMSGACLARVVVLESGSPTTTRPNGSPWYNWVLSEIDNAVNGVRSACDFHEDSSRKHYPNLKDPLAFTVDRYYADHPITTMYEPVDCVLADFPGKFIPDFLRATGQPYNNPLTNLAASNHAARLANNYDWCWTIFIVDSTSAQSKLSDGSFAWSYFWGPATLMTYDNGAWGISRMGQVCAHETGHIFGALDEYAGSGSTYSQTMGVYGVQNRNAYDGNPDPASRGPSLMAEAGLQGPVWADCMAQNRFALEGIGWRDTGNTGVFDALRV